MKAFAVKSNAKVNSRQTCEGGEVKVNCEKREKNTAISLDKIEMKAVRSFVVASNAVISSKQIYDGGDVKVSCRERNTAKSLGELVQGNAKVSCRMPCEISSRQICEGGDVKVSCRQKHCHIS